MINRTCFKCPLIMRHRSPKIPFGNKRAGFMAARGVTALVVCGFLLASVYRSTAATPGEDYLINAWLTDQGLPENIVNAIAQTPDGYLWCGTTHGLARFDGVHFKIFNVQNTPELGSGRIR